MVEAWKSSSWLGRLAAIAMTLAASLLCLFLAWGSIKGVAFRDPNAIPANIQHSPLATERLEVCVRDNVRVSTSGGQRVGNVNTPVSSSKHVYPNALIECLYIAGFELRLNGEPVRRVTSE